MADTKLSALTELDATPATGDELYIRDVSEATADESKRITVANLVAAAGSSQAVQSDIEAETNEDTYVPPDLIKHSPGVAKAWCQITAAGALSSPSYNIASVTDTGTGSRVIIFDTDFSSAIYGATAALMTDSNNDTQLAYSSAAAGQIVCQIYNSGSLNDRITGHSFHGDQ